MSLDKAIAFAAKREPKRRVTLVRPQDETGLPYYLQTMVDLVTETVYRVVSHALFAKHQLLFSFYLCVKIKLHTKDAYRQPTIEESEWNWFLHGGGSAILNEYRDDWSEDIEFTPRTAAAGTAKGSMGELITQMNKSPLKWITLEQWKECQRLSDTISGFAGLCSHITNNHQQWNNFNSSDDPFDFLGTIFVESIAEVDSYTDVFSSSSQNGWSPSNLSNFQKLLLVKILKADCLMDSIRKFVTGQLGETFVNPSGIDLREIFEESGCRNPLIFILSPGSDPTSELLRFVKEIRGSTLHLDMISLGRGQGPRAEDLIRKAYTQKGKWVFLQNCHLAASFMPKLQDIVRQISNPDVGVDSQFRLWLSSKPDPVFPVSVLQAGLKMTVEPPPGLKANLKRSFASVSGIVAETVDGTTEKVSWKKLLFGLCFFNAIVQERRKFGSLGWNIPYEFINSDLEVAVLTLCNLICEEASIPWTAIRLLTGEIVYGGRVTDDMDQRCLLSLLKTFYRPEALENGHKYSSLGVYGAPPDIYEFDDFAKHVDTFPSIDQPEIFGMHPNADFEHSKSEARTLIDTLVQMQPRRTTSAELGKTNDDYILELASEIIRMLPEEVPFTWLGRPTASVGSRRTAMSVMSGSSSRSALSATTPVSAQHAFSAALNVDESSPSAMLTVLKQEKSRYDHLLNIIHNSVQLLCLAIKGEVVMSDSLEDIYDALLHNKVPTEWQASAYASTKSLGSWVDNLTRRIEFLSRWLEMIKTARDAKARQQSRPSSSMVSFQEQPRAIWLQAFFFPQGFLTAVLQTHARKYGISVDSLAYTFEVTKDKWAHVDPVNDKDIDVGSIGFQGGYPPDEGILVFGLFLDGARWDTNGSCLEECVPKQRFYPLPEIHFMPKSVQPSEEEKTQQPFNSSSVYECPLYQTSARASSLTSTGLSTNFITTVQLSTKAEAEHWIRRGVALLCQLDY